MSFKSLSVERVDDIFLNAFFSCPICHAPFAARLMAGEAHPKQGNELSGFPGLFDAAGWDIVELIPKAGEASAPDDVPEHIARNFVQAEEARKRKHLEAAGMAYRRTLELSIKDMNPDLSGSLASKINKIGAAENFSPSMVEWAHSIRVLGNESAHEDDQPAPEAIEDLAVFTKVFLEYAYTMPAKIRQRFPVDS